MRLRRARGQGDEEADRLRELEYAELWHLVLKRVVAEDGAPADSPTWLAARALLPELEYRLEALGWHRPLHPADALRPPED